MPPDYIVNNWTEELLELMAQKLSERKERESNLLKGYSTEPQDTSRHVSAQELAGLSGGAISYAKKAK